MRPCKLWTGAHNDGGYGMRRVDGRWVYVHRDAWEKANGRPVPDGLLVMHSCDTPACYEPTHLFAGSQTDNMQDAKKKGRLASPERTRHVGVANGNAKLTPELVADIRATVRPRGTGQRGGDGGISGAARRYGVTRRAIKYVLDREVWK